MPKTTARIGPDDHGQKMTLDDFEAAEVLGGSRYELGGGVVVVADGPRVRHLRVLTPIRRQFAAYVLAHRALIDTIAGGASAKSCARTLSPSGTPTSPST